LHAATLSGIQSTAGPGWMHPGDLDYPVPREEYQSPTRSSFHPGAVDPYADHATPAVSAQAAFSSEDLCHPTILDNGHDNKREFNNNKPDNGSRYFAIAEDPVDRSPGSIRDACQTSIQDDDFETQSPEQSNWTPLAESTERHMDVSNEEDHTLRFSVPDAKRPDFSIEPANRPRPPSFIFSTPHNPPHLRPLRLLSVSYAAAWPSLRSPQFSPAMLRQIACLLPSPNKPKW
jgi:hypothetical protein